MLQCYKTWFRVHLKYCVYYFNVTLLERCDYAREFAEKIHQGGAKIGGLKLLEEVGKVMKADG